MSVKLYHEWAQKAEEDFEAAHLLGRNRKKRLLNTICFHSQQSAEKYLKAYLTLKKIHFSKTHDLILLKNLCSRKDGSFELISDLVISLNPYAVEFRYPGDQANRQDAKRAFSAAQEIRDFVKKKIK